jgi:hypothetical protein
MNAPAISGEAFAGPAVKPLDAIRARVGNSTRDDLYAPVYADRRCLLGLVDEISAVLREVSEFWAGGDAPEELTQKINAALAKVRS